MRRPIVLLTIDLEDYRRQELRDHRGRCEPAHPAEVERQLDALLGLLESIGARATFFSVGRLAKELAPWAWRQTADRHSIGCHGYEHLRIRALGAERFCRDLRSAKAALEDVTGRSIVSYRAPYFSSDHCDPWFGQVLARAGFVVDSSRRIRRFPGGYSGTFPLEGGGGEVTEVPLPAIGPGSKRLTIIGGTYFRLLPLRCIVSLLERARSSGFHPMVYLHPYDIDDQAAPLDYDCAYHFWPRLGDKIRRTGRSTAAEKLRALSRIYELRAIDSLIGSPQRVPAEPVVSSLADLPGFELHPWQSIECTNLPIYSEKLLGHE